MRLVEPILLLLLTVGGVVVSGVQPADRLVWALEATPVLLGLAILVAIFPRFRFTALIYRLAFLYGVIILIGAHYTYPHVPPGYKLQDWLHLSRNPFDRISQFAQGLVLALVVREVLLRRSPLLPGTWLFFCASCAALSLSACYEFVEWWLSLIFEPKSDVFRGLQGDAWDPHWDMLTALLGALVGQILFGVAHERAVSTMLDDEE